MTLLIYPIPVETLQNIVEQKGHIWENGPMRGKEDRQIRWIKVTEVGPAKTTLGLSDDGYWVRGGGATIEVANGPLAITFLPCLEVPIEEFRQAIRNGLVHIALSSSMEVSFPYSDLLVTGLTSGSELWTKLALDRIEEGMQSKEVDDALRLASKSAPTQKLRHRAKSLLPKTVQ